MTETSTPQPDRSHLPSKDELYKKLYALADQYFNGPYPRPDTRQDVGRKLRDLLLTIDRREGGL